jgi:hypothetical protein
MLFRCINEKELIRKGLTTLGDLDLQIDPSLIGEVKSDPCLVLVYNCDSYYTHRLPRSYARNNASIIQVWIINDESYTDNLDDDTFTYFKYEASG